MNVIFGEHDEATLEQFRDVASRAERAALMADGHRGYVMPIGGVAAYDERVSPIGVGVDTACGNCAIRTNIFSDGFSRDDLEDLADEIEATIGFGMSRPTNDADDAPVDHALFEDPRWDAIPARVRGNLRERARSQLGTVGGGNHYVDVFRDEDGYVWVGVHFGSRGLGFISARGFVSLAQGGDWTDLRPRPNMNDEVLLDLDTPIGHDYWAGMELAGLYAYAGREWVARKVVSMMGGAEVDLVHNHHNFAWREEHGGRELIVVRKGATPAFPGQRGFVGGSMGDDAVILEGAYTERLDLGDEARQRGSLFSTVHGAGRVMGRMQAKGKWKKGRLVRPGRITHDEMHDWLGARGVVLRGGDLDEAPQAYRRLPDVLAAQGGTVRVTRTLTPLIVVMAPGDTHDPYRD